MLNYLTRTFSRFVHLFDKSALSLIIPSALILIWIDPPMLQTLAQWLAFAPILAGTAVIVSRIVFPQVKLTVLISRAEQGNVAAGIVSAAIIFFVAALVIALAIWSKA